MSEHWDKIFCQVFYYVKSVVKQLVYKHMDFIWKCTKAWIDVMNFKKSNLYILQPLR